MARKTYKRGKTKRKKYKASYKKLKQLAIDIKYEWSQTHPNSSDKMNKKPQ